MADQASKPAVLQTLEALYQHVARTAENEDDDAMADKVLDVMGQVTALYETNRVIVDRGPEDGNVPTLARCAIAHANVALSPRAALALRAASVFAAIERAALARSAS